MCLSQTPRDWAVNRFTACPFNSLSAYNGGWHAGRGAEGRAVCVQREPGCARGPRPFNPAQLSSPNTLVFLSISPQGVFYPLKSLQYPPFPSVPFVLPERSDSMLYIGISKYFFKSASYAYFTAGAFSFTLTTKEVRNVNG